MINGEVVTRNKTTSGLPVASGAKKTSRGGKEVGPGGKKARAGIKGKPRPLRPLGNDKMAGVAGIWTIGSPALQESKNHELTRTHVILRIASTKIKDTQL